MNRNYVSDSQPKKKKGGCLGCFGFLVVLGIVGSLFGKISDVAGLVNLAESAGIETTTEAIATLEGTTEEETVVETTVLETEPVTTIAEATVPETIVPETTAAETEPIIPAQTVSFSMDMVPVYSGRAYAPVNGNVPFFTDADLATSTYESYSPLDSLGRCGPAIALIGYDLMPTEPRGNIGAVKPSGWHLVKYDDIDGNYLYNRCHLIGYQLTGENANPRNLITGTRYMNVNGMLPFENQTADYIEETYNHVLYRVTPVFDGDNLLATGVLMEAMDVETLGRDLEFCVFCYNVQPGITIDYATGDSEGPEFTGSEQKETTQAQTAAATTETHAEVSEGVKYVLNTNTHKFHYPYCSSVEDIADYNYAESSKSRDELIAEGYKPCKRCNP